MGGGFKIYPQILFILLPLTMEPNSPPHECGLYVVTTEESVMEVLESQGQVTSNTAASASLFEGSQPHVMR